MSENKTAPSLGPPMDLGIFVLSDKRTGPAKKIPSESLKNHDEAKEKKWALGKPRKAPNAANKEPGITEMVMIPIKVMTSRIRLKSKGLVTKRRDKNKMESGRATLTVPHIKDVTTGTP